MNVLSLFNGMSFCRMALEDLNIKVNKYYSSEIDKFANKAADTLYPDTIQLGDVTNWRDWDIDWGSIDLVTGGFPCQAWSMAGKQQGDKDERGMLFWTMLDIMKHVKYHNPKADFLIENVKMKKEFEEYITLHTEKALGKVHKILINSALVSAQNRNRYYWTNFEVTQPEDKGILLKDIIEHYPTIDTTVSERQLKRIDFGDADGETIGACFQKPAINTEKALTLLARDYKGISGKQHFNLVKCRPCEPREFNQESLCHHAATATDIKGNESVKRVYADSGKSLTLTTMGGGHREPKVLIKQKARGYNKGFEKECDKSPTLSSSSFEHNNHVSVNQAKYRKLTPRECMRLQTVPEDKIDILLNADISNTQLYKMTGNGWTLKVISHILKHR